jgi:hypothetical protein
MGECAYYFKALFPSVKEAKKAFPEIRKLFREIQDVHSGKKEVYSAEKYPLVADYLRFHSGKDVYDDIPDVGNSDVGIHGEIIYYSDSCVWHFSDWGELVEYILEKFSPLKAVWDSEENGCGSLDGLSLYDWEGMVGKILSQRPLLPLLLGLDPELDALVEARIRRSA